MKDICISESKKKDIIREVLKYVYHLSNCIGNEIDEYTFHTYYFVNYIDVIVTETAAAKRYLVTLCIDGTITVERYN